MKRVMVNFETSVGDLVIEKARSEKRSASAYILLLVENDLRASGLLTKEAPDAHAELHGKISAVLATRPELKPELEKFVRKHARAARRPLSPQ